MSSSDPTGNDTFRQKIEGYFVAIDEGRIEDALEILHPNVTWCHMQVWQDDPNNPSYKRTRLEGRDAVADVLLAYEKSEEAKKDVKHQVQQCLTSGQRCAFLGEVVGPSHTFPMMGWVDFEDDQIIRYIAAPRP